MYRIFGNLNLHNHFYKAGLKKKSRKDLLSDWDRLIKVRQNMKYFFLEILNKNFS